MASLALKDLWQMYDYRLRIEAIMKRKHPRKVKERDFPWRLVDKRRTQSSFEFAYEVPSGYSYQDLEKQYDALCASVGSLVEIKNRAGVVIVAVHTQDLPTMIPYQETMLSISKGRSILLGYDILNKPIIHSFKIPHMLISGQAGYGKTDAIRFALHQIFDHIPSDFVNVDIIDLKKFSFIPFKGIPHIGQIVTDLEGAVEVLEAAYNTMQERAQLVWEEGDRGLTKSFPWKIVLIDEASQISPALVFGKHERKLAEIAASYAAAISCVGREASVGLIYCTQYPTREVIHGQIRANMEAVLCFKTENDVHSNVALGASGAETITTQGRAFYKSRGSRTLIQVPYVGDDEVWDSVLQRYKGGKDSDNTRRITTDCVDDPITGPNFINRADGNDV